MKDLKWTLDKEGYYNSLISRGKIQVLLRIRKSDGLYEGFLINKLSNFKKGEKMTKIFEGQEKSLKMAMIKSRESFYRFIRLPAKKQPGFLKEVPAKLSVIEGRKSYALQTNIPVDEIKYIKGKKKINSPDSKTAKLYEKPVPKGYSYNAVAIKNGQIVDSLEFGSVEDINE